MSKLAVRRFLFGEIAMHGDSTTVELFYKNNVFLICFILKSVSFFYKKFGRTAFDIYQDFCTEKTSFPVLVLKNRFGLANLLYGVFRFEKSPCMGTHPPWHYFLKITSS